MFLLHTVKDTIRIPADMLAVPTVKAIQTEIDAKYPNRVLIDVGLVVGRYDDTATVNKNSKKRPHTSTNSGGLIRVGHGVCPTSDRNAGSHHECIFQLIVFRPFVNEVCVGIVQHSSSEGLQVSMGFMADIFIPAYWMLNPSHYDEESGLWVWTPQYDDEEEGDEGETDENEEGGGEKKAKIEEKNNTSAAADGGVEEEAEAEAAENENRYEMEIGSEIRFKVKAINFTQITNTAKGMQATTISTGSTMTSDSAKRAKTDENNSQQPLQRRRSSSVGLDAEKALPSAMQIIGSICEDGLGLTSWWASPEEGEEEEGEEEEEDAVVEE